MTHVATESTSHNFKLHCIHFLSWFTCAWNPITAALIGNEALCDTARNIVTAVVTDGVAMVIIFSIDNMIFSPGLEKKVKRAQKGKRPFLARIGSFVIETAKVGGMTALALVGDAKGCELEDCNLDFGKSKAPKRTSNKFGDSISLLHANAGSCQGPAFAISESNIADL